LVAASFYQHLKSQIYGNWATVQLRLSLVLNGFLSAAPEDQTPQVSLGNQKSVSQFV
jgi:hypothetical protein